jgi:hypothetical protein
MRPLDSLLLTLSLITPARAEFVLLSQPPSAAAAPALATHAKPRPPIHVKSFASAPALSGFGSQVPLSFAIRQIVPAGFRVAIDETVDKDLAVDWKGGKPWRETLSDALRPLGLAVAITGAAVAIRPVSTAQ